MSSMLTTGILQTSRLLGMSASGGTINKSGAYTYHTFSVVGSTYFDVYRYSGLDIQYLIIAGGGGGAGYNTIGRNPGGGGGAARANFGTTHLSRGAHCQVYVGGGGAGGNQNNNGNNGQISQIYDQAYSEILQYAQYGYGGSIIGTGGASGTGYSGGVLDSSRVAGGGAGVSQDGYDGSTVDHFGEGGSGSSWNGYRFGGGGGGGNDGESDWFAPGGIVGGGTGASFPKSSAAEAGVNGTGAGGGGGCTGYTAGAAGGSGIVIIRYLTP